MYYHKTCPVCKQTNFKDVLTCKDYTVSGEEFVIQECLECGFKFTNPIPEIAQLGSYYKSEDYISHSNTKKGIIARVYHLVRKHTLKKKIELVSGYVSRGTILDYGSGTGMFLKACKEAGWNIRGLEPDSGAREIAKEMGVLLSPDKTTLEKDTQNNSLSAITLWHVLEHVTDLEETLNFFWNKLSSDGILIIAVPNHISADARYYGKFWAAYDVPRHLYHFEPKTIEKLLTRNRFKLVNSLPMKFDSFYVSMLSEKYKSGRINYIKAFINGLMSNLSASSPGEYSSVIYIFKKQ